MRMLLRAILLASSIVHATAQESPAAEEYIIGGSENEKYYPGRLDPVSAAPRKWEKQYHDLLHGRLKSGAPYLARIIIRPAFSGESCLRIHNKDGDQTLDQTEEFFLTYTAADKSIWYSIPENSDRLEQREVHISTLTTSIPSQAGRKICHLFQRYLLLPKNLFPGGGLDGVTYEFSTPAAKGEAWCPAAPHLSGLFAELSQQLIDYCKASSEEEKERILQQINTKAAAIEKRLPPEKAR